MTTTKTSQKTEDMLDQTFANFDSEVTGAQTQTDEAGGASGAPAGKKNNNMMLFVGLGVAAVGLLGYMFVLKPILAGGDTHQQQQQVAQTQTQQAPVVPVIAASAPEAQSPVVPVIVASAPEAQSPVVPVIVASASEVQSPVAPEVQSPVVVNVNPVVNNAVAPVVAASAPDMKPVVEVNVHQKSKNASQQVANSVVDELKGMFEQQSNEFKTVLTDIDGRVNSIETAISEQKNVNQKVDERLTALESGKTTKSVKVVVKNEGESTSVSTERKVVKKSVIKKIELKKESKEDSSVLVDKSSESPKVKAEKEVNSLPKVEFHSVYGGRVWLKNSDGSLSTFSNGDRLPTGEVIKSVNDETFEVITNKRTIKN